MLVSITQFEGNLGISSSKRLVDLLRFHLQNLAALCSFKAHLNCNEFVACVSFWVLKQNRNITGSIALTLSMPFLQLCSSVIFKYRDILFISLLPDFSLSQFNMQLPS